MDLKNNIVALILPVWLLIIKDILPYFIKKYGAKKDDGTYNQEVLIDIRKELVIAVLRFPCDLVVISAGYIIARIFICTEAITHIKKEQIQMIADLTLQLNTNHVLFWVTILLVLPLFVLGTQVSKSSLYPRQNENPKKIKAILITIVLYIISLGFALWLLFTN